MNLLRSLKKSDTSANFGNFRPVQPINNRTVRASFQVSELNTTSSPTTTTAADTTTTAGATTNTTTTAGVNVSSSTKTTADPNVASTSPTTSTTTDTRATELATVQFDYEAGSSAVSMTAGLFLSMLFAALLMH